ncbi:hypothetical protein CHGG_06135 [Chaetomium globosum CBS 148.51]|uniref:Uncharacterized protein n=1 Tax=Chaetomium globosum (strain ATCC 6205 / CBS 148.51 / DSM 1962 / NBRC 6347 / NRRL 1970) TaxID=306901 RepID=Q2H5D0_CHAGB|nr:uncharacterized protein CHGG_06135 [Chaetomium globosum CBS 148.51]EAQ89516.1 hypothetical protein CHGG_06135 [Chaetomium globosum CBS 148.51]
MTPPIVMSRPPRKVADEVIFNDRKYHPQYPPSEQFDVLTITQALFKLGRKKDTSTDTKINEASLRNFAAIYPRLYQVPHKSQARFRAWMSENEETIRGWDVGDFFKTPADDARDRTKPREPGCPVEVMEAWKRAIEGEEQTDQMPVNQELPANGSDNGTDNNQASNSGSGGGSGEIAPFIDQGSVFDCAVPPPATGYAQGYEQGYQGAMALPALEASLGMIKEAASRLEQLSDSFHLVDGDAVKQELLALAETITTNVDGAMQAGGIISQPIAGEAVSGRAGRKRRLRSLADEGENENEDEDKSQRRIKARRLQSDPASLETEHGLAGEHGSSGGGSSGGPIADAFQNDQSSPAKDVPPPRVDPMELPIDPRLFLDPDQLPNE